MCVFFVTVTVYAHHIMKTHDYILILVVVVLLVQTLHDKTITTPAELRIGFDSVLWGPHYWLTLHLSALNTPREFGPTSRDFEQFLYAVSKVLPCGMCRDEFALVLNVLPPHTFIRHGRIGAVAYVYLVHNTVSVRTGNPNQNIKFLQMEEQHLKQYTKPFACNIPQLMRDMYNDAQDKGIYDLLLQSKHKLGAAFNSRK